MSKRMSFKKYLEWLDFHRSMLEPKVNQIIAPPHPGAVLNQEYLMKFGISQTEFAKKIGCTHAKINEVIHKKRGVTPMFALDLEAVTSIKAETWMRLQAYYDLYRLRERQ